MRQLLPLLLLLWTLPAAAGQCPSIVSQSPYITRSLQWLGLEECIVGVSRYDHLKRSRTGGVMDPDEEALAELKPDLWFISSWTDREVAQMSISEESRVIQLRGFGSLAEIEENLRLIGEAAMLPDADARARRFTSEWQALAAEVGGEGLRTLIITGCSGTPYAFGRNSWLTQLFREAGFDTVNANAETEKVEDLDMLIEKSGAERLFTFSRGGDRCPYINPKRPVRIVHLKGEHFLHPAPVVLDGLRELRERRAEWR